MRQHSLAALSSQLSVKLSLALSFATGAAAQGGTWFVDTHASPGGNGLSWATAFTDLDAAFSVVSNAPAEDHVILLREGTYRKGPVGTDPRDRPFVIPDAWAGEVRIVGGFLGLGGSTDPDVPDGSPVRTILHGRPFTPASGPYQGTSVGATYHVLAFPQGQSQFGAEVSLEHLAVTGGRADDYLGNSGADGARGGAALV